MFDDNLHMPEGEPLKLPQRCVGVLQLPWSIPVNLDCLELTHEVAIGNQRMTLRLPRKPRRRGPAEAPKMDNDEDDLKIKDRFSSTSWGREVLTPTNPLYLISNLAFSVQQESNKDLIHSLSEMCYGGELERWCDILRYWVAAWSSHLPRSYPIQRGGGRYEIRIAEGKIGHDPTAPYGNLSPELRGRTAAMPLTLNQLKGAFDRSSRAEHLPVEHRLLIDARDSLSSSDYRRAVIDAGTAAEVAIASFISETLLKHGLPIDFVDRATFTANGLIGLIGLYASSGRKLPVSKNAVASQLAEIRNRAAHGGLVPTPTEASKAIKVASALVGDSRPLPSS